MSTVSKESQKSKKKSLMMNKIIVYGYPLNKETIITFDVVLQIRLNYNLRAKNAPNRRKKKECFGIDLLLKSTV